MHLPNGFTRGPMEGVILLGIVLGVGYWIYKAGKREG
jgi:hypothetical protein